MPAASQDKFQPLKSPEIAETRVKLHDLSITDVINYLKSNKNFYASYLASFEKIEDPNTPTMSVSVSKGKYVLRYNGEWYKYLSKEEVSIVLEHECLHILCNHIPRFAMIEDSILDDTERMKFRMIFNAAADLAVNTLITDFEHNKLPSSALTPKFYGLEELKSMEWYAEELAKQVKVIEVEVEIEVEGDGEGDGQEGNSEEQSANAGGNGGGGSGNAPGADGSSGGKDGQSTKPKIKIKQKQKKVTSGNKDLDEMMNQKHEWDVKDPDTKQSTRDICSRLTEESKKTAKETYAETGKMPSGYGCGDLPGSFVDNVSDEIKACGTSTWKRLVHRYVRETKENRNEFRINKPKRTRWSLDDELGLYGAEVENPKFNIDVGIDTSGSMSSETLAEILTFAQGILKMDDELDLRITEYDHCIQKQYTLNRCGEVDSELLGRGGTNFNQFFKSVCESLNDKTSKAFKPDIVFNFTDGEASPPMEEYRFNTRETPLIWVLMQGGYSPCSEYGEAINM